MGSSTETKSYRVQVEAGDALGKLKQLSDAVVQAKERLAEAQRNNDAGGVQRAKREIKEATTELTRYKDQLSAAKSATENLDRLSLTQLKGAYRGLKREVEGLERNSAQYREGMGRLGEIDKRIKAHTAALRGASSEAKGLTARVTDFFKSSALGMVGLVTGAVAGAIGSIREAMRDFAEFNKKTQELSSLTGLGGDDLKYLTDQAKELSTSVADGGVRITQSADSILEAFTAMGSAKAELLSDKEGLVQVTEAALVMGQAAGMEAKPAVEALALTMNQFGAGADQVSRYINTLAAGSQAGAASIEDVSKSIKNFGASAAGANLSVEESVGLVETLAAKGIKGEVAGTALNSILTRLQTGADEFNPKIVGMQQALDNLASASLSTADMVKIFGAGQIGAGQILINNREEFARLTKAVTDTDTAYRMAATNTDTQAARAAQSANAWKNLRVEIGERLQPVVATFQEIMLGLGNWLRGVVPMLSPIISVIRSAVGMVGNLVGVIGNLWNRLKSLLSLGGNLSGFGEVLHGVGTAFKMLGDGLKWISDQLKYSKTDLENYVEMSRDLNQALAKGTSELNVLFTSLSNVNQSEAERGANIAKINELYGEYLPQLLTERSTQEEIAAAQELANQALTRNILLKQQSARLEKLQQEEIERTGDLMSEVQELLSKRLGSFGAAAGRELSQMMGKGQTNHAQILEWARRWKLEEGNLFKKGSGWIEEQVGKMLGLRKEYQALGEQARSFYSNVAAARGVDMEAPKKYEHARGTETTPQVPNPAEGARIIEEGMEAQRQARERGIKEQENLEDLWLQRQTTALKKSLLERKLSQEEFEDEMLSLELTYLIKQRATLEKQGKRTERTMEKIYDKQLQIQKRAEAKATKARAAQEKAREQARKAEHARLVGFLQTEENEVQDNVDTEAEIFTRKQEEQMAQQTERAKRYQDFLKGVQSAGQDFALSAAGLIGEVISGSEEAQENFGQRMAELGLEMLHKVVRMAIGQIWASALASPESVASYGVVGTLKATAITAVVEGAFQLAKRAMGVGTKQHFAGRLLVQGAEDGQQYQVPYLGELGDVTYVDRPALISERGGEIIIDHQRSQRIMLDYPHILSQIRAVPQHAGGRIPAPGGMGTMGAEGADGRAEALAKMPGDRLRADGGERGVDPRMVAAIEGMTRAAQGLERALQSGIEATISYHQLKHTLARGAAAERGDSRE